MKAKYLFSILALLSIIIFTQSCEIAPDPGFNGQLSGKVLDTNGQPVSSDILSNTIIINALGVGDISPIVIRVDGSGSFKYTKLFPKVHQVSVSGPVYVDAEDTVSLDFSGGEIIEQNFVVEPFISIDLELKGSPSAESVTLSYSAEGNRGKVIKTREIYCSTSPYPTSKITSGAYYTTITKSVSENIGEQEITGLKSGTRYYIRMGANGKTGSKNDLMNYSEQIIITTP